MLRILLAILFFVVLHSETLFSFSSEEEQEVTCKCYFQCEGLQFVLPQLCALRKQFPTSVVFFLFKYHVWTMYLAKHLFLLFLRLLYSQGSFHMM